HHLSRGDRHCGADPRPGAELAVEERLRVPRADAPKCSQRPVRPVLELLVFSPPTHGQALEDATARVAPESEEFAPGPMKKVLMVAFHYPPCHGSSGVQRTLAFSRYLPEHGWRPIVLTAHPRAYPHTRREQLADIPTDLALRRAFALDTG